jgi:hypothetical protein
MFCSCTRYLPSALHVLKLYSMPCRCVPLVIDMPFNTDSIGALHMYSMFAVQGIRLLSKTQLRCTIHMWGATVY